MKYCPFVKDFCYEYKCAFSDKENETCLIAEALGFYVAEKRAKEEERESEEYCSRVREKMDSFILRGKTYD